MKASSLYIHIPYCVSKCIYCDFFSGGASRADWLKLKGALINELQFRKDELKTVPDTLYIGGGTPSLIPSEVFVDLVDSICGIINPSRNWTEFTIEVNPDDISEGKCRAWRESGVNRVSMGIQSFNDSELKAIRRRHDSEQAICAFNMLRGFFSNLSIDLMFGIPGQTIESWKDSVSKVISLGPEHISAYSLMLEEGTALTTLYNQGRVELPEEEACNEMWEFLSDELRRNGYDQYEISNYSRPGFRSIHNSRYWSGNPYLGLGPSAHSYDGHNLRRFNPSDLNGYLSYYASTDKLGNHLNHSFHEEEILNEHELIEERILTRMRVIEGLDLMQFRSEFGDDHYKKLLRNAAPMLASGEIRLDSQSLSLTSKGIMTSDRVILSLSM